MNPRAKNIYEHVTTLLHPFHLLLQQCYTKLLFTKGSNFVLTCRTPGSLEYHYGEGMLLLFYDCCYQKTIRTVNVLTDI